MPPASAKHWLFAEDRRLGVLDTKLLPLAAYQRFVEDIPPEFRVDSKKSALMARPFVRGRHASSDFLAPNITFVVYPSDALAKDPLLPQFLSFHSPAPWDLAPAVTGAVGYACASLFFQGAQKEPVFLFHTVHQFRRISGVPKRFYEHDIDGWHKGLINAVRAMVEPKGARVGIISSASAKAIEPGLPVAVAEKFYDGLARSIGIGELKETRLLHALHGNADALEKIGADGPEKHLGIWVRAHNARS